MPAITLATLMNRVGELCPNAIVAQQDDGNVVVVTNMILQKGGILLPFDDEFDLTVDY